MSRFRGLTAGAVALALAMTPVVVAAAGRGGEPWLHIRVEEAGESPSHVRVNVPLKMLESLAAAVEEPGRTIGPLRGGSVQLGGTDMTAGDLRRMWRAVRDAADMEFVTVEEDDRTVRVAKDHGSLVMRVGPRKGGEASVERVEAKIPLDVIDALLSGDEDTLQLAAALRALARHGSGDLITVRDRDERVRIWIDERGATGDEEDL